MEAVIESNLFVSMDVNYRLYDANINFGIARGKSMYSKHDINKRIKQSAAEVLCMETCEIDEDKRLQEFGMDSIIGVELINRLNKMFSLSLQKSILYDYPTVNKLTDYLMSCINVEASKNPVEHIKPATESEAKAEGKPEKKFPGEYIPLYKPHQAENIEDTANEYLQKLKQKNDESEEMTEVVSELEKHFGKLPLGLLSKYDSISELAEYLVQQCENKTENAGVTETIKTSAPEGGQDAPVKSKPLKLKQKGHSFEKTSAYQEDKGDIAVIGISGRYPGSKDIRSFWNNLKHGRNLITEIPEERWDWREFYHQDKQVPGKSYSKWGGFIDEVDQFDPLFFNISPREAPAIDPQVRLLLETVWETLEDAGYTREKLNGMQNENNKTGIFIGSMYQHYHLLDKGELQYNLTVNSYWALVNRCSYFFNFKGPSMAIDTACSSSLTAVHMACESIRRGECTAAIAGGINLTLYPGKYLALSSMGMLESQDKSYSMGNGDGYIPGEGVGTVLLKSLSQAVKDKDHIYGVIRGSAVNHGGLTDGFTVPNADAQRDLIIEAMNKAGIDPRTISYVEASTTGLPIGDKQEIKGLSNAFTSFTRDKGYCSIGSVKSNIGHLEAASGISQLTKVLLQMKYKTLVPTINIDNINSEINFSQSPFHIQKEVEFWKRPVIGEGSSAKEYPRRAAINSFGAGGSNAHVIIEEYCRDKDETADGNGESIITLSAHSEKCLKEYARRMVQYLTQIENDEDKSMEEGFSLHKMAYTLQTGREVMGERLAVVCSNTVELIKLLEGFIAGNNDSVFRGSLNDDTAISGIDAEDKESREYIEFIAKNRDFKKLARLWVSGVHMNWEMLYDIPPEKLSLPTCPFEKKRYWIDKSNADKTISTGMPSMRETACTMEYNTGDEYEKSEDKASIRPILKERVKQILGSVLYLESTKVSDKKRFVELGLDSVLAVEFSKKLSESFHINFKVVKLYDCLNVERLTDYLAGLVGNSANFRIDNKKDTISKTACFKDETVNDSMRKQEGNFINCKGAAVYKTSRIEDIELRDIRVNPPGDGEIQIAVKASAANFADILCAEGLYPTLPDYPFVLGFQVSGIVSAVGKGVSRFKAGDEVVALTGYSLGGHAQFVNTSADCAVIKPRDIGFEDACGYPDAFTTAYYSLYEVGKLLEGEHVLIQCAAGGVGLMAVQLAKLKKCVIYGTSSSPQKLEYLKSIGVEYTINYKTEDVSRRIMEITGGNGVDVVLNTLSGDAIQQGINSLAPGGRYLEIAVAGLRATKYLDLSGMVSNQSFHSIDLRRLWRDSDKVRDYLEIMMNMAEKGLIKTIVHKTFDAEKVKDALQYIQDRRNIGKVVLSFRNTECNSDKDKKSSTHKTERQEKFRSGDIAVIAMSGRFPGAENLEEFWSNLKNGVDSVSEIPRERWDLSLFYDPDANMKNKTYSRWGGYIKDADAFDSLFFNITPIEAEMMDPQQRLFLEEVWKTIELAGYSPAELSGSKCGVFVGVGQGDYNSNDVSDESNINAFTLMGSCNSILAGRVAYLLNLKGPCISIDTACSSSLVAVHQACMSIVNGESDMAIAGGVCIMSTPAMHIMASKIEMLSKDGKCKTFDNAANGFVPGEGVGAVILKPLNKAIEDNDFIYGVIKGTKINQDGQTNGITAPSGESQTELETGLYDSIGINPGSIGYVEAHGTGTKLGDPIEVEALTNSFRKYTDEKGYCAIGSVKTNIGHGLSSAGIGGLIKTLLCVHHKVLVPSIHFNRPNENIDFDNSPFYVNTTSKHWESRGGKPRLAVVSAFGFSGTNAHIAIEEAPLHRHTRVKDIKPYYIIALSAKTPQALKNKVRDMLAWIENNIGAEIGDISYTATVGRTHFAYRIAVVAGSTYELQRELADLLSKADSFTGNIIGDEGAAETSMFAGEASALTDILTAETVLADSEYKQKLTGLADMYLKGCNPDWNKLYPKGCYFTVSLPVYPFEKQKYWRKSKYSIVNNEENKTQQEYVLPVSANETLQSFNLTGEVMKVRVEEYIKGIFSRITGVKASNMEIHSTFDGYGINSLVGREIIKCFEEDFGRLPVTLLFENLTIADLSKYFFDNHNHVLTGMFGSTQAEAEKEEGARNTGAALKGSMSGTERYADSIGRSTVQKDLCEDIAIIGMTGRYPGADGLDEFWENLKNRRECIGEIPEDRWDISKYYHPDPFLATEGKMYSKWGGFIHDADKFDTLFFNISPKEAELMDPQERLFLEASWAALEDAGYMGARLKGLERNVGVFAGVTTFTYNMLGPEQWQKGNMVMPDSSPWTVANRISYALDFRGPSMTVDTACSSSLTAIHMACESLKNGECRIAIAGGINLYLHPSKYIVMSQARILSPKGKCCSFGAEGDGMVPGEGVGVFVLKPFKTAIEDGDNIYAVIKGTGINHGGSTSGYTVPNPAAQTELIDKVLQKTGIDARTISYIEAHGTGTPLGDPIEISGLTKAFRHYTQDHQFCSIGSVKPNIGHLEAAAGIAGLTKVVMQLRNKQLVPNLHCERTNANIKFEETPFYVQKHLAEWKMPEFIKDGVAVKSPRRAGVSAFGAGGANAHVIVEEYNCQVSENSACQNKRHVIVLSARNKERLKAYARKLMDFLDSNESDSCKNSGIAITLQQELKEIVAEVLSVSKDNIDARECIIDYGFDAIMLTRLADNINRKFNSKLTKELIGELRTISAISDYLLTTGDVKDSRHPAGKNGLETAISLECMAYTLQEGREAMEERLALIVSDFAELRWKLAEYCGGKTGIHGLYEGSLSDDSRNYTSPNLYNDQQADQLAKLWVSGEDINWKLYYNSGIPQVMSLPAYPFARERYWAGDTDKTTESGTAAVKTEEHEVISSIYLKRIWERSNIPEKPGYSAAGKRIVVFGNDNMLAEALTKEGAEVILVKPSSGFTAESNHVFEINPAMQADYENLVESLIRKGLTPDRIIHAWAPKAFPTEKEDVDAGLQKGIYSLMYLSKALIRHIKNEKVKILYIYESGAVNQPLCEGMSGFFKTVYLENPGLIINSIEMRNFDPLKHAGHLAYMLENASEGGTEILYDGKGSFSRRIVELSPYDEPKECMLLKENGVYLVTGGAGGLGRIFARFLASRVKARIVLTGRSPIDRNKHEVIREIESLGYEASYIETDISNKDMVFKLIEEIKLKYGKIDGIIHCAGVIRDSFVLKKNPDEMEEVLAPKVFGTIWLDEATKYDSLDFFVMFSSIAGLYGNIGQSDYAYGNSFMDSFAEMRNKLQRPGKTVSIQWPFWKNGGMNISKEELDQIKKNTGLSPLEDKAGIEAFEFALSANESSMAILFGNVENMRRTLNLDEPKKAVYKEQVEDDKYYISDSELVNMTQLYLKGILSKILKLPVERIDSKQPLEKYGIDSIMITDMNRQLESHFGRLSKTLFFEYQSIEKLAEYFAVKYREKLIAELGINKKESLYNNKAAIRSEATKVGLQAVIPTANNGVQITEDIAIIGMSGRYPMAENLDELWENLKNGRDCISEIPHNRWNMEKYYDAVKGRSGKYYCKWGGFMDNIDMFDPLFFNISPREAEMIDPQERMFLQTVWHTIEDAGYTKEELSTCTTGVFVGVTYGDYQLLGIENWSKGNMVSLVSSHASVANRVSYLFNFNGPSIALDTMCSSSLTAVHLACKSIYMGECDMAVAGGVNVCTHPNKYVQLSQGKFLSSDGRCRSFGEGGDGYVPGEGVGAVLLKSLKKAVEDGDRIYAVIKGSCINHGGKTNGYTVPNPNAQADLIANVFKKTGISPRTISYIEAHGTGTILGDPIEITGLLKPFEKYTSDRQFCSIGSVKSNIGHLEAAAGIAGLTKVVLQMKHKQLVPSIHSEKLNSNIDFDSSPFYVQRELEEWKQVEIEEQGGKKTYPRRAGISSFGAGGSNAHILIEEYQPAEKAERHFSSMKHLVILSAKDEERLKVYAARLADYVYCNDIHMSDVAYTLQVGREAMQERLAVIAEDTGELKEKLFGYCRGEQDACGGIFTGNIKANKGKIPLVMDGEEGKEFICKVIQNNKLEKLAQLWVTGIDMDWKLLYRSGTPERIKLPVYPFEEERYWVPEQQDRRDIPAAACSSAPDGSNTDDIELMDILTKLENGEIDVENVKQFMGVCNVD